MENYSSIQGLTSAEVAQQKSLGLVNETLDNYNTTYFRIVIRNIFNIINLVIFPLLAALFYFQIYTEVFSFSTFLIINTLVSIFDEVRIKRQIDSLKKEFQKTVTVFRDGEKLQLPVNELVAGDFVYGNEGEGVVADGEIQGANYLQVDESVLTGESNYIEKAKGEKVFAGSFIVTGNCVYVVGQVGEGNYLNQLGKETLKYDRKKSSLQRNGDRIIVFLVIMSLVIGFANLLVTNGESIPERLLSLTTIISLIIPQTLVFLFTLSFTVSIIKLSQKGVLVRKAGSIQELAAIDVICFDKTGTITTNEMKLIDTKSFGMDLEAVGHIYNAVREQIVGVTKTQELLHDFFSKYKETKVTDFNQVPFTSKQKYSMLYGVADGKQFKIAFGASSSLMEKVSDKLKAEVQKYVTEQELNGNRVLVGIFSHEIPQGEAWDAIPQADQAVVFTIEETLNPGINELLTGLADQNIDVKIISGDSLNAVSRIAQKIGIPASAILDLSKDREILLDSVASKSIFTRANPDDKLVIVNALKATGHKVAMIGDGINDVLAMKAANVSIAMENAAKITHDSADIVLLHNDYSKVPTIFFEGDNIIFNLKISTKIFLAKTLMGALIGSFFTLLGTVVPLHPTSTLIFSFLGSSAPSYVFVFTRQKVSNGTRFFLDVISAAISTGLVYGICAIGLALALKNAGFSTIQVNTSMVLMILGVSAMYSIYLAWEAGKLKSLLYILVLLIVPITLGVFETLLPITAYERPAQIQLIAAAAVGLLFLAAVTYPFMKSIALLRRIGIYLGVVTLVSVFFFFPFQSYYGVINIPTEAVKYVALTVVLGWIGILLAQAARKLLVNTFWKE